MKRRGFLGMLAVSPLAAKQVAEEASMKLTGVSVGTSQSVHGLAGHAVTEAPRSNRTILAQLFKKSIPDFKLHEFKKHSKQVHSIHPNICALKSVSLSTKFKMQKERNFSGYKQEFLDEYDFSFQKEREEFQEKHGWWI